VSWNELAVNTPEKSRSTVLTFKSNGTRIL
jgi:hypothetical protein